MKAEGEKWRDNVRTATAPSREEIESTPIGGPGSSGEPSRQRANTYLNSERMMLGVLRSAIRRMQSTGRVDQDVLNAYAKIKSEKTERENNYGVGLEGTTQRAERWLNSLDAAGQVPAVYSADWANMTRAKNKTLDEQGDSSMFLEDDMRGKRPVQPDLSNQFTNPSELVYQPPGVELRPMQPDPEEEEKKSAALRNSFNSLFS